MLTNELTIDLQNQPNSMTVGVLSDTHGVVSDSVKQTLEGCEVVLHAGDVCGQPVLDELNTISPRVIAVGGNNDGHFSYALQTLPEIVHVQLPGGTISLLHGHQFGMARPSHNDMRQAFVDSKVIVYGHTHRQVHETSAQPWILNPGAAGDTRTNGGPSCALILITTDGWNVSLYRQ